MKRKSEDGNEICKYSSMELYNYQKRVKDCWGNSTQPNTLMKNFCLPALAGGSLDGDQVIEVNSGMSQCSYQSTETVPSK